MRRSALLLSVVLGLGMLTGCSGGGPYCDAVDQDKDVLTSFGQRTDEAYTTYAEVTAAIAKVAPEGAKKDWNQIAEATQDVVGAHDKAGIRLQDMKSEEKLNALSKADLDRINAAYEAFNDTKTQREDVVRNVDDECGIDLSEK